MNASFLHSWRGKYLSAILFYLVSPLLFKLCTKVQPIQRNDFFDVGDHQKLRLSYCVKVVDFVYAVYILLTLPPFSSGVDQIN